MQCLKIKTPFMAAESRISTVLRNVDPFKISDITKDGKPEVGDIILARVTSIGDKKELQNPNGRNEALNVGDFIAVAYGQRYALAEYEAVLPKDLGPCHLVSAGGVAARITAQNTDMGAPTTIEPLGFLTSQNGEKLNLKQFSMPRIANDANKNKPIVIAVMGTGMDAGKTTTAAATIEGFKKAGYSVGFGKATGTGLSSDLWSPLDAGAVKAYDFVDMGYPATYKVPTDELVAVTKGIIDKHTYEGRNVIILEIADGIYQPDNIDLLRSPKFKSKIDGVILAADGALGAMKASESLTELNYRVLAISGVATKAPLAAREIADNIEELSARPAAGCLTKQELSNAETAERLHQLSDKSNALTAVVPLRNTAADNTRTL